MPRFPVLLSIASVAFALVAALASPASAEPPADYRPDCDEIPLDPAAFGKTHAISAWTMMGLVRRSEDPRLQALLRAHEEVVAHFGKNFRWKRSRGYLRQRKYQRTNGFASISRTMTTLFGDVELGFEVSFGTEKVLIGPANRENGRSYLTIVYDVTGNYFRVETGYYFEGQTAFAGDPRRRYVDDKGRPVAARNQEDFDRRTHFNAFP